MKKSIIVLFFVFIFSLSIAYAAPAPMGIAINNETRECAGYWPGDEYASYGLPPGWKAYFPEDSEENRDIIITEFGKCNFRRSVSEPPGEEEKCCKALGLNFVSKEIGTVSMFSFGMLNFMMAGIAVCIFMLLFVLGVIILIIWLMNRKDKKKKK